MKFLKKLKSSNFWVSMISAVVLILQAVFNIEIRAEYLNQIIMAILGLLVMSGIVTDTNNDEVTVSQKLDMDELTGSIANVLTKITSSMQENVSNIVSQISNAVNLNIAKEAVNEAKTLEESEEVETPKQNVEIKAEQVKQNDEALLVKLEDASQNEL